MKNKLFLCTLFIFFQLPSWSQIPSLYNTHTLAESVVNPYVGVFDDQACRKLASNFLVPNLYFNSYLKSDVLPKYNWNPYIKNNVPLDWGNFDSKNNFRSHNDFNLDILTIKYLVNKSYQSEIMFNYGIRGAGGAKLRNNFLSDISDTMDYFSLLNKEKFTLQGKASAYLAKCIEFGWRSDDIFFKDMNVGFKVSYYDGIGAIHSNLKSTSFVQRADSSILASYKGNLFISDNDAKPSSLFVPEFKNIGLALSFGFEHILFDEIKYSVCVKDLGFISFAKSLYHIDSFEDTVLIQKNGMYQNDRKRVWDKILNRSNTRSKLYVLPSRIDAGIGFSPFDALNTRALITYIPMYQVAQINLMADAHYKRYHAILNVGYGNDRVLQSGLTFMARSTRWEAFLGFENIYTSIKSLQIAIENDFSDLDRTLGFALNFGFAYKLGSCNTSSTRNDGLKFKNSNRGGGIGCPTF